MNEIFIWEPRYRDDVALIDKRKVQEHNYIVFTKAKSLKGQKFYIPGWQLKQCPLDSNGKIDCYAVPMTSLMQVFEEAK